MLTRSPSVDTVRRDAPSSEDIYWDMSKSLLSPSRAVQRPFVCSNTCYLKRDHRSKPHTLRDRRYAGITRVDSLFI